MWSAFPLVRRRPVHLKQGCGPGSRRGWFPRHCTSKGQTGCAAALKGTALARAVFQRAECLACGKLKHERPGEICVFGFDRAPAPIASYSRHLCALWCCLHENLIHVGFFSSCLLHAAPHMTPKATCYLCVVTHSCWHRHLMDIFVSSSASVVGSLLNLSIIETHSLTHNLITLEEIWIVGQQSTYSTSSY